MIVAGDTEFPENVGALIKLRIPQVVDPDIKVLRRPLHTSDPTQSVGVFAQTKLPDPNSVEFRSDEPTIKRYNCILQGMVVNADEEKCLSIHSILSQRLWRMLFHDYPLHVGLTSLVVVNDNVRERFQKRGVVQQRYLSNEVTGNYIATSWIEWWFETETVAL